MFDLNPAMMFGVSVCSLVLGQLTVTMLRGAQGLVAEREQFRLRKKLLETEVEYLQRLCESSRQQVQGWEGLRKFRVDRKVLECLNTVSLYLKPHDGKPLPAFHPGQYLTFSFRIPGSKQPVVRCYSLSDSPSPDYYRITVHKIGAAAKGRWPGLVSSYIVEQLAEGDLVDVKAPAGHFYLDLNNSRPIALVAAGVGVTPLISMVNAICERGIPQKTRLIFGVRNGHCHPFKRHLADLQRQHPHLTVDTFYSRPLPEDQEGVDYAHQGRVTLESLRHVLPSSNFEFYLCGPPTMMSELSQGLRGWGVPPGDIHFEAFGAQAVKIRPAPAPAAEQSPAIVRFSRSGKALVWDGSCSSLLELAESQGISLDSGCLAGSCGTCRLAVKSGTVAYPPGSQVDVEEGSCLACVAVPQGDLVVDA